MTKIQKFILAIPIALTVILIGIVWMFANWQSLFGEYRPMAIAEVIYTLEVQDKSITTMYNIDNDKLYVTKKDCGFFIDEMKSQGYEVIEHDKETSSFLFQHTFTYVSSNLKVRHCSH